MRENDGKKSVVIVAQVGDPQGGRSGRLVEVEKQKGPAVHMWCRLHSAFVLVECLRCRGP